MTLVEPIANKLFGQCNDAILYNLRGEIREFKLDPEVIAECLTSINIGVIKSNPYRYFGLMFALATSQIAKRRNAAETQKIQEFVTLDMDCASNTGPPKTPQEYIAEIKERLKKGG